MKLMKNTFKLALAAGTLLSLTSCMSNKKSDFLTITDHQDLPPMMESVPSIEYKGIGIKYECENMYLHNCAVLQDNGASGKFCIRLIEDSSTATMKIKFPEGTYECLVKEKASNKDHSAFYIYLDGIATRVYPSNPPSGQWELTTRVPVYFTLEEPRTLTVSLSPHSDYDTGSTGMDLDYIQFVRR
ncbi:hypothetical protein [Treponema sp.]|uniref:hypothetical protein n=1 Tax=Treponema sp. TaxID=166 RepID=UPI00298DCE4D|nr:hypothetical protein [Treponema sp.]MCQ2242525.1 hypothetical protein [Treponema sp.]